MVKKTPNKKNTTNKILIGILLIVNIILLISIANILPVEKVDNINTEKTGEIKTISNEIEFQNFLKEKEENSNNNGFGYRNDIMMTKSMALDGAVSELIQSDNSASEYSTTNIQEKNVDEADIVKNDGKYIYTLSKNTLNIVEAYPAKNAKLLSSIKINGFAQELFLKENKLVIFSQNYKEEDSVSTYDFLPEKRQIPVTQILIFDIENKKEIKEIKNYTISGNYQEARLIEDQIYLISKEYSYRNFYPPIMYNGIERMPMPKISYFDIPNFKPEQLHTIATFNLEDLEKLSAETYMLASGNTVYFSENNIYITYKNYISYLEIQKESLKEVVIKNMPNDVKSKIKSLDEEDKNYLEDVTQILEKYYKTLSEKELKDFTKNIEKELNEFRQKYEIEHEKTTIHKIEIDKNKIEYKTKTEVEGDLLNQFALSEDSNGNLRLATTTSVWGGEKSILYNNVFVLDENLKTIGKLKNIAEDEKIYSTRFIGDKLFMVTFKQIDPLFVIDLENPKNPKILGKLKIPGYSTYLHPMDENHLIGIGHDTKESEWGGIINDGVKISLFDISDLENPKEVDTFKIKGKYTDSIALNDHHAFLFDKNKELLVMPIREFVGDEKSIDYKQRWIYEQKAIVLKANTKGFEKLGYLNHGRDENNYWNSPKAIKRSLFMDDNLYTISEEKIQINDLKNNLEELNKITLINEKEQEENFEPIYYD